MKTIGYNGVHDIFRQNHVMFSSWILIENHWVFFPSVSWQLCIDAGGNRGNAATLGGQIFQPVIFPQG